MELGPVFALRIVEEVAEARELLLGQTIVYRHLASVILLGAGKAVHLRAVDEQELKVVDSEQIRRVDLVSDFLVDF